MNDLGLRESEEQNHLNLLCPKGIVCDLSMDSLFLTHQRKQSSPKEEFGGRAKTGFFI